jgi:hypothetical protein
MEAVVEGQQDCGVVSVLMTKAHQLPPLAVGEQLEGEPSGGASSGKSEPDAVGLSTPEQQQPAAPMAHQAGDEAHTASPAPAAEDLSLAPLPPPDASEGPEAAAEYEAYLQRWEAGDTLAQRWHRWVVGRLCTTVGCTAARQLAINADFLLGRAAHTGGSFVPTACWSVHNCCVSTTATQLLLLLLPPLRRLTQSGKLADIRAEWDDWQLDLMLVDVRAKTAAALKEQARAAAGFGAGVICSTRLRRGRGEVQQEADDSPSEEPRRVSELNELNASSCTQIHLGIRLAAVVLGEQHAAGMTPCTTGAPCAPSCGTVQS